MDEYLEYELSVSSVTEEVGSIGIYQSKTDQRSSFPMNQWS